MNQAEIVIYRASENADFQLEVRVEDETVWLTLSQLVALFNTTKQNISLHISNIFREEELDAMSTVMEYLTVRMQGNVRALRNLNTILSRYRMY